MPALSRDPSMVKSLYNTYSLCGFDAYPPACSVAQRKRVGLITQRSEDRNLVEQGTYDTMAEWLRRLIRNQLGLSRAGSSPVSVVNRNNSFSESR